MIISKDQLNSEELNENLEQFFHHFDHYDSKYFSDNICDKNKFEQICDQLKREAQSDFCQIYNKTTNFQLCFEIFNRIQKDKISQIEAIHNEVSSKIKRDYEMNLKDYIREKIKLQWRKLFDFEDLKNNCKYHAEIMMISGNFEDLQKMREKYFQICDAINHYIIQWKEM